MRAPPEIERFVRETLGCGCPDTVFADVRVTRGALLPGAPGAAWWLEIGGRLLIAVTTDEAGLAGRLPAVVQAARERRDADGFNRFRLVVATGPRTDAAALRTAFASLAAGDERLHLHLVEPAALPPLVATETPAA